MKENEDIMILISGGSLCFFGDWFGRPYDNFHEIKSAKYKNDLLTVEFCGGEHLLVFSPKGIINKKREFQIQNASKVEWIYTPYGEGYRDEIKHEYISVDGKIIKKSKYGNQILSVKKSDAAVYIG